jgi:hypothetical protein
MPEESTTERMMVGLEVCAAAGFTAEVAVTYIKSDMSLLDVQRDVIRSAAANGKRRPMFVVQ